MVAQFVGAGWAFPVRTDPTGGIALVAREREIEEAIRLILGTAPGERPMRPEFGCRIHDLVFGPANASTAGEIAYEVRAALARWEPRIDVLDVAVGFAREHTGTVYVDVQYAVRGSNDPRNLVFPFYVIPDHAPPERAGLPAPDGGVPAASEG
ncbi:GPW/gp25 family protein [Geodermatophilus marinus]|uniref:GPW/gp25 family protein n=1 Tax=Geodermatophilus sp. LHW52908 TaxID=2303986 RepID=UPI000E3C4160|nr:GPW/gp25 family protein [Geodermatophilus sp. LHW52908]RFU18904.1 baseplate protein [Geodermatophilus sp. LHW52908]